jgi:hypothetical protein
LAGSGVQPMHCWRPPRITPGKCDPRMWSSYGDSGVSFVARNPEQQLARATARQRPVVHVTAPSAGQRLPFGPVNAEEWWPT